MQPDSRQLVTLKSQLAVLSRTISKLQRELEPPAPRPPSARAAHSIAPGYRLYGQDFAARNGNDILASVLRHFAELEPEFPERFCEAARRLGRSRRYVGRSPQEVYPNKPKLWASTVEFAPDWYVGTNENNETKLKLLRSACRMLGLRFGADLQVRM